MMLQAVEVEPSVGMNAHELHPSFVDLKQSAQQAAASSDEASLHFQPPAMPEMPIQLTPRTYLAGSQPAILGVWGDSVSVNCPVGTRAKEKPYS